MRPENAKTHTESQWPVFDSIGQCASASGIPLRILRKAKADGAPGFRNTRVHIGELLPYLFSTKAPANVSNVEEVALLNRERRMAMERENAVAGGLIHDANYVEQRIRVDLLMPLRDGLQELQKKFHRFKYSKPKIVTEILEKDLPALLEKLRGGATEN